MASATSTVKTSVAMFPLRTVNEVRNFFASQCVVETNQQQHSAEPDLVLLSIGKKCSAIFAKNLLQK